VTRATPTREELTCANRLKGHLERQGKTVSFEPRPDFPDFDFTVDGERWAVEIAGLVPERTVSGERLSQDALAARAHGLRTRIERAASGAGSGRYAVHVDADELSRAEADRIVKEAVEFILSGEAETRELQAYGSGTIERVSSSGMLAVVVDHSGGSDDIREDQRNMLRQELDDKLPKLLNVRSAYARTVLCFWNRNWWHKERELRSALSSYDKSIAPVDEIYFVDDNKTLRIYRASGIGSL